MCGGAKWKREVVPDHKFDFVDTREFCDNGFMMRMKYMWLYIIVFKSFLVYVSDIFSAITMLSTNNWSNEIFKQCQNINGCFFIPFDTGKWLFVGCIIFSFLLLAYESRKAKKIIASRDISYAFTNVMANNYYSLRSYDHFCFFDHISNSTKVSDDFAFFVFFVFKSWKRLLLADGPRQTINALTLYAVWLSRKDYTGSWYDVSKYFQGNSLSTSALTVTSFFTVVVFAGSLLLLTVAAICYIPLLCHIRGNLKEYCCHKVDKRIGDVIKRRQKQRLADAVRLAKKEARGDFSHLKNKKGELIAQPLPQPTLPNLSVDDDDDTSSMNTRAPAPSTYTQDYYHYQADKGSADYPPPMPAYNPYSTHQAPGSYAHFNPSTATFGYDDQQPMYDDDTESLARLTTSAAPFSNQPADPYQHVGQSPYGQSHGVGLSYDPHNVYEGRVDPMQPPAPFSNQPAEPYQHIGQSPYGQSHGVGLSYDPHDVYEGRVDPVQPPARQWSPQPSIASGLAYDDSPDPSHYPPAQSLQNRSDNPYVGYSSNPGTPQQSQIGGRDYDGGRGQSRVV